jgi:hypothetical protein
MLLPQHQSTTIMNDDLCRTAWGGAGGDGVANVTPEHGYSMGSAASIRPGRAAAPTSTLVPSRPGADEVQGGYVTPEHELLAEAEDGDQAPGGCAAGFFGD